MEAVCRNSGEVQRVRLSYPLYITHIPFVYVLANFTWTRHPGKHVVLAWIFVVLPLVITVVWLALKYLDEPVRARLTRRYGIKRAAT
jgi:peptidoglycan/LPS O-acetylase OafA/YrhL